MNRRGLVVYGVLLAAWGLIVGWQVVEHVRVGQTARVALINRARDISSTLGVTLNSQRRFGVISKERIETVLNALVKAGELNAIALLNAAGEVVASAGAPIDVETKGSGGVGELWTDEAVTLMNLVDLGTNVTQEAAGPNPAIVLPRRENSGGTNRPPPGVPPPTEVRESGLDSTNSDRASRQDSRSPGGNRFRGGGDGRRPFGRPYWMSEEEYQSMIQKQGVHSFVIVMPTLAMIAAVDQDLWLRSTISVLAAVSVIGFGLAWRNLTRSSELEVRLVRASEMNANLKQMNLAAAGLAHETRNPLNIIRGLAQMITKQQDATVEVRRKSREIIDETDRVTAQLNEFINYSRPREVRPSAVVLGSVVGEIARTLAYDLEDKCVRLQVPEQMPSIEADEQLLRQALFNLLLNAVQAAERGGNIEVAAYRTNSHSVVIEIRDTGPGVPPEQRTEIFKPYFTTHQKGTGLGLAVVQQIVLAHGWEIECLPNEPRGAIFRITHIRLASGS